MKTVVLASHNQGKIIEFRALFAPLGIEVKSQSDFGIAEIEETGLSFVENALLKARHVAKLTGLPALADDSGLMVEALGGEPGLYSARYAGPGASAERKIEALLTALEDYPENNRRAQFVSVLVYLEQDLDPLPLISQGLFSGYILKQPTGASGFGYDPIFGLTPEGPSVAELAPAVKNRLSHRGQALAEFIKTYRLRTMVNR